MVEKTNASTSRLAWRADGGREGSKERGRCGARAQRKGEGGVQKKGADAERGPKEGADAARVSKREHGGAVMTMEWWCERPDGGARWRYGETTKES